MKTSTYPWRSRPRRRTRIRSSRSWIQPLQEFRPVRTRLRTSTRPSARTETGRRLRSSEGDAAEKETGAGFLSDRSVGIRNPARSYRTTRGGKAEIPGSTRSCHRRTSTRDRLQTQEKMFSRDLEIRKFGQLPTDLPVADRHPVTEALAEAAEVPAVPETADISKLADPHPTDCSDLGRPGNHPTLTLTSLTILIRRHRTSG